MASIFTVQMSPPEHRGMTLELRSSDQHFCENVSTHIYPFLDRLISALHLLRGGFIDERIKLHIGAPECEFCLQAEADSPLAELRFDIWPDFKRSAMSAPRTAFFIEARREEIVAPFVAALKTMRANVSDSAFEDGYGKPFPTAEYQRLLRSG